MICWYHGRGYAYRELIDEIIINHKLISVENSSLFRQKPESSKPISNHSFDFLERLSPADSC